MATVFLYPITQFLDQNGNPLNGGLIYTYIGSTTTPQATFTDSTGTVQNQNPVQCDSAGRCQMWLSAASYKFIVKTSAGVTLETIDNYNPATVNTTVTSLIDTGNLTMQQSTAATSGANQTSNTFEIDANIWNGSASVADKWQFQDVVGTGTNPTSTLTVGQSGSTGAAKVRVNVALDSSIGFRQNGTATSGHVLRGDGTNFVDAALASTDLSDTTSLVTLTGTQTLTNKTLTAPVISTISNTGTITLPTSTDTLVGKATTDTLKNKTLNGASSGNAVTLIDSQDTGSNITGDGTDKTVFTKTIPAGTIGAGKSIRITAVVLNNNAVNPAYKVTFGATSFSISATSGSGGASQSFYFTITNKAGVQNSQIWTALVVDNTSIIANNANTTSAEDTTGAVVLKLTANEANPNTVKGMKWLVTLDQ